MQKIRTVVMPVAGLGTRFLPATKTVPKELFPIIDKPVIQYLVEEAVASGIERVVLVINGSKELIRQHFSPYPQLEEELLKKGKEDLKDLIKSVETLAEFVYAEQAEPLGDGHAILCAKEAIGSEPFAVMFGDDLVDHDVPALKQLMQVYEETGGSVVALTKVATEETTSYGMIAPKAPSTTSNPPQTSPNSRTHHIEAFVEKPQPQDAPSDLGIIGKYVLTPGIIPALESATPSHGGELRLIDGLMQLQKQETIYGHEIEGTRYDTGTPLGLITASLGLALKDPTMAPAIQKYLQQNNSLP